MHKGYTHFNARFSLHLQRDMLRKLEADLIFLQEVQDLHSKHRHSLGAKSGQMEFLADSVWYDHCYGKNAVYPNGHHGNAMLSKFPISQTHNLNISAHGSEQRGCTPYACTWACLLNGGANNLMPLLSTYRTAFRIMHR
ncbi:MAG: hypothetical protein RL667_908 [Pseudomonadota bacterium]